MDGRGKTHMRKTKQLIQIALVLGVVMIGKETYATEITFPKTVVKQEVDNEKDIEHSLRLKDFDKYEEELEQEQVEEETEVEIEDEENQQDLEEDLQQEDETQNEDEDQEKEVFEEDGFEEEEYVRIAQPDTDKKIKTFDSEINIMGEAREGAEIEIITYVSTTETDISVLSDALPYYTVYKLNNVGATQTFSQLIKLYEGHNHILICYTYTPEEVDGMIEMIVDREPEEVKEQIKNYIVSDPMIVLEQITQ